MQGTGEKLFKIYVLQNHLWVKCIGGYICIHCDFNTGANKELNELIKKEGIITTTELGKQYMKPLDEYIKHEEEPLSDKQIEALSHLMKANKPSNPMNYDMLAIGIVWAILVFLLLLI